MAIKSAIPRLAATAFAAQLLAPGVSTAAPSALVMGPLYAEPARSADNPAPPSAGGCQVQILELKDARRAPETLGSMLTFRAIDAPADRQAWLRSVVDVGLTARGFRPSFVAAGAAPTPDASTARIRLQAVWISVQAMNKVGSVVVRMSAAAPGAQLGPEKVYRGDQTGLNWMGSQTEFNGLVDRLFADALDAMAADLRPMCSAPPTNPTPTPTPATATQ